MFLKNSARQAQERVKSENKSARLPQGGHLKGGIKGAARPESVAILP